MSQKPSKFSPTSPRRRDRKLNKSQITHESNETKNGIETSTNDDHKRESDENLELDKYPQFITYRPKRRPCSPSFEKDAVLECNDISQYPTVTSGLVKKSKKDVISKSPEVQSRMSLVLFVMIIVITVFVQLLIFKKSELEYQNVNINMEAIIKKFPEQGSQFWKAIVTGINDTISLERPTSYIFVFESEGEQTIKKLLLEVSKYTVFKLTDKNNSAINFTEEILESEKFLDVHDYGSVISHLRGKLENNGLMIIENMERIPQKYALAFHNLCDDISPVVKKSAFFFTHKVDNFKKSDIDDRRNVEEALRKSWNFEEDYFVPLFTRISSMILRVHS